MRAQMRHQLSIETVEWLSATSHDGELASIILRANRGEELTDAERLQYESRQRAYFRRAENAYYQYREGLFDEEQYQGMQGSWRGYVNQAPSIARMYCRIRPSLSPSFRTMMNGLVEIVECKQ